jgi:predicted AAA+ superfamily ATPase
LRAHFSIAYAATYLKEEVQAESLTRNLEGFARFLGVAAEWAGHHLGLANLASAAQVPRQSAIRYFEILEDTLIVQRTEPFTRSPCRRFVQHPKFYFFDVGVRNGLLGSFEVPADRIGSLFEQLVYSQLVAGAAALDRDIRITSYRTEQGVEVDFVVRLGRDGWALELKASRSVDARDLRGLRAFAAFQGRSHRPLVLYLGDAPRRVEGIDVLPWQEGLRAMGL